ncbi:tRNA lysidine(34) synthetase TilS [Virgibacillus necropolis]|uniref:tRNA(Ile)-lysidine synthase n=1 Tax=Virgibacillus necropolis TaxID=163877 RepID=A0A221M7W2_9BACI|nr:tRNA lysidine(34) synthetase TilS [Virgibacillus necropolis]ASN03722.1 tRNA lysidine(34) synthetase TilS [Virgibacillus necropolis]
MKDNVLAFMKQNRLIKPNSTLLIGVSGGPDSMALLHFLDSIKNEWNLKLVALTVDHQLRGEESKEDLRFVESTCDKWNIKFCGTSLDVPSYKEKRHVGTQVAAREMRYQFFFEKMEEYNADYLALGHHGDDQVETMLMGFVRSSNSRAMSGIPVKRPFNNGTIIRPFLSITKKDIHSYCQKNGIHSRLDPSNEKTDYTRNYFRQYVLPLLKNQNHTIHSTAQQLSKSLQTDEDYLSEEAKKLVQQVILLDRSENCASFDINLFQGYHTALQRRAYHLILKYLYDELPKNLSYMHEEQFFALLSSQKANGRLDFPHRLKVVKSYCKLIVYFENKPPNSSPFHKVINIPGHVILSDGSVIHADFTKESHNKSQEKFLCGRNQVALPLHIRTRRTGDRMTWKGLNGSKKIKDIFIDEKIPARFRDTWPIVTDNNGEVLWLVGLKQGQPSHQTKDTSFIQLYLEKAGM